MKNTILAITTILCFPCIANIIQGEKYEVGEYNIKCIEFNIDAEYNSNEIPSLIDELIFKANNEESSSSVFLGEAYNLLFRLACKGDKRAICLLSGPCLTGQNLEEICKNIKLNEEQITEEQFFAISNYLDEHLDDEINYKTLFQKAVQEAIKNSSEPIPVKRSISDTESEAPPKAKEKKINDESPDLITATAQGSL